MKNNIVFTIPIILLGCANVPHLPSQTSSPSPRQEEGVKTKNPDSLSCPQMNTIDNGEYDYHTMDTLSYPDGVICSDGKAYCYSNHQRPIPIPEISDGYECTDTDIYDDEITQNFLIDEKFYSPIFDESIDEVNIFPYCSQNIDRNYIHLSFKNKNRSWKCTKKSCICGGRECPQNSICNRGKCSSYNIIPADDEICSQTDYDIVAKTNNEITSPSAIPGEDSCFATPDVMKLDDKYIQYGSYNYSVWNDNKYFDVQKDEAIPRDHYLPLDDVQWMDIVLHRSTAMCDDSVIPNNISDYICVSSKLERHDVETYSFHGFHCAKDTGCVCGKQTCDKHARCYHGQCIYDSIYLAMACAHDFTPEGHGSVTADSNGWCVCGDSHTPPNMKGFVCNPYIGMICKLNDGCMCGSKRCKKEQICLSPGFCSD